MIYIWAGRQFVTDVMANLRICRGRTKSGVWTMPETTTVNREIGLIEVDSFGVVTIADWEKTFAEILEINRIHGFDKVLVDTSRQVSIPETFTIFEFGQLLSNQSRFMKYAIIVGDKTSFGQKFLETVTLNRGANYSVFTEKPPALEWLLSG
jgi:hypothetical protein